MGGPVYQISYCFGLVLWEFMWVNCVVLFLVHLIIHVIQYISNHTCFTQSSTDVLAESLSDMQITLACHKSSVLLLDPEGGSQ